MIEKYKALEAENERLKPRHEAYVKMLGELLAVLHADGGHYQYEHGTEKAVADAITKYYELTRQLAELTEWDNQIGRTNYELRKQLEGEKAAALNYRADALDAEKQLAEHKADAERWRAYAKRKADVIRAGMGQKILRDLEGHDALPAFYKEMKKGTTE